MRRLQTTVKLHCAEMEALALTNKMDIHVHVQVEFMALHVNSVITIFN